LADLISQADTADGRIRQLIPALPSPMPAVNPWMTLFPRPTPQMVEFENRSRSYQADASCESLAALIPKVNSADDGVGCIHNRCIRT
jgi:hypothetical protein